MSEKPLLTFYKNMIKHIASYSRNAYQFCINIIPYFHACPSKHILLFHLLHINIHIFFVLLQIKYPKNAYHSDAFLYEATPNWFIDQNIKCYTFQRIKYIFFKEKFVFEFQY